MNLNIIDYKIGEMLARKDIPFAALISAAMRKNNALKSLYPGIWRDLQKRYNAPGGFINDEAEKISIEQLESIVANYLER